MNNRPVASRLETNLKMISELFPNDKTLKIRRFSLPEKKGTGCGLVYIDGMANDLIINQNIIGPILKSRGSAPEKGDELLRYISEQVLFDDDIVIEHRMEALLDTMLCGDAILFVDGCTGGLCLAAKNWPLRSIEEPDGEKVISGPHEGFTESLIHNLTMIRRRITDPDLSFEFLQVGKRTKTSLCICFMKGLADPSMLSELRKRINAIHIDGVFDSEYIEELIRDRSFSPFRTTGSTQRPDVAAAKLLEGRAAILVNGTPVAVTVPYVFLEYFQSPDDYYTDAFYASFNRFLRFAGFFLTISLPAVYLALVTYHQEMLPLKVLLTSAQSRSGMPMSTMSEIIFLILIFEIIREGSAKIPSSVGNAFSIVGGIVLGQASVDANFVSLPIVIIVAFTAITGMIVPRLKGPVLFLRFGLLFLAGAAGLLGYLLGMLLILFLICSMHSFYVPYESFTARDLRQFAADTVIRMPWPWMRKRPLLGKSLDIIRQRIRKG